MTIEPRTQATINGLTDTFTVTPDLNLESLPENKLYDSDMPVSLNIPEIDLSNYRMEDFGEAVNLLSTENVTIAGADSICD
jgi:hypothetical protein